MYVTHQFLQIIQITPITQITQITLQDNKETDTGSDSMEFNYQFKEEINLVMTFLLLTLTQIKLQKT